MASIRIQLTHTVAIYNIPEPLTTENSDSDKRIPAATCKKKPEFIIALVFASLG